MVVLHLVEDDVRPRSTVVDVAEDMEGVDGKTLYHIGDGDDEVVGPARGDDGIDNHVDIGGLVMVLSMFV